MVHIFTDTASDYTPEQAKKENLHLMPLSVSFGDDTFKSGFEITNEEFYQKLAESAELPQTSQVNPYEFEEAYKEILDQGDEIVSIHISSKLSGTYQSALIAKENLNSDRITVIDSLNVSGAEGLLVHMALRLRDEGAIREEIETKLVNAIPKLRLYIVLDTLEYLKKGGRISPSVAFIGGVLGLHPVVTVTDGEVAVVDKVKGKKSTNRWILDQLAKVEKDPDIPFVLVHSNAPDKSDKLRELLAEQNITDLAETFCMGPIVGTHGGPNAVGIMYIEK